MSAYISDLERLTKQYEVKEATREDANRTEQAATARERLTPLEDRLTKLLATIPSEVQLEGLSLTSLQAGLRGRWRGHCHPGELGRALRKLGFRRKRAWRRGTAQGFSALWFPPSTTIERG